MLFSSYLKKGQKYMRPLIVFIICSWALYLRLHKLALHKLWSDELHQLSLIDNPFPVFLKLLTTKEYCSYLSGDYYLVYPFFKIFSYNKWGLAIPHIIITIVGFYLLYLISKRYLKTIWGYIITFGIVCFNPTLIEHATEIRVYAVLPTLGLAMLYLSQKLVDQNVNMSIKNKCAIGIFFVIVIWFHAYGILIFSVPILFCLAIKRDDPVFNIILKDTFKLSLVVLCVAMPLWLLSVFGSHQPYDSLNTFKYIHNPLKDIVGFLKDVFANLIGYKYKALYFLLIGVIFPFVIPYKKRTQQILFLIILVLFPISLILLFDIRNSYEFLQRQFIWVMPFFAFFLGWTWDSFIYYIGKKNSPKKLST